MKKNYIAPNTEMTSFSSLGLMQAPQIGFATSGNEQGTWSDAQNID